MHKHTYLSPVLYAAHFLAPPLLFCPTLLSSTMAEEGCCWYPAHDDLAQIHPMTSPLGMAPDPNPYFDFPIEQYYRFPSVESAREGEEDEGAMDEGTSETQVGFARDNTFFYVHTV